MNKNFAKVQLSAEEMRLVTDPAWILTKNSVIQKVVGMFAELAEAIRVGGAHRVAPPRRAPRSGGTKTTTEPKISKGENYKGLPWVMLDYPRVFGKEDVYAIRTFFLWGHAFSVTLHLKGEYMRAFLPGIMSRRGELEAAGFGMSVSDDEWAHEHTAETYGPLGEGQALASTGKSTPRGAEEMSEYMGRPWVKLSARVELEHWDEAPEKLLALHQLLMDVSSPAGERDL
jgi:hypothetical protein